MNFGIKAKKVLSSVMALSLLTAGFAAADTSIVKNIIPTNSITAEAAYVGQEITDGTFKARITDVNKKLCEISGYVGTASSASIWYTVDGYSVTAIGNNAFKDNKVLKTLSMPRGVGKIGDYAFANSNIETVHIAPTVSTIGRYAFYNCDKMTSFATSYGTGTIGDFALANCDNLTTVDLSYTTQYIGYRCFINDKKLSNFSTQSINCNFGREAFKKCSSLYNMNFQPYAFNPLHSLFSSGALIECPVDHINSMAIWAWKSGQPSLIVDTRDYVEAHASTLLSDQVPFYVAYDKAYKEWQKSHR